MEKGKEFDIEYPTLSNKDKDIEKRKYEPGSLVAFRKMTDEQYNIFLMQLADSVSYKLDLLRKIIDDDMLFLQILDELAGTTISFPNRKQAFQYLDKTFMYTYAKSHGFTEEAYNSVAKHFGEKLAVVKNRILRISKLLDDEEYASLQREQEKLRQKRREKREANRLLKENKEDNEE